MTLPLPENWPLRAHSRMVRGPRHHWHVQQHGTGPDILLLHGAGGSAHSFAGLARLLAQDFRVFVPDLPGHGFTKLGAQRRSSLTAMAEDVRLLCAQENVNPTAIIGHSAGAAIALELARAQSTLPIVGINPALSQFEGIAGILFPVMAKLLAAVPFMARMFSGASANPDRIKSLIDSTGSKLPPELLAHYRTLVSHEAHVKGTLSMMAQWDLDPLIHDLGMFENPTHFIVGTHDMTVPSRVATRAAQRMQNSSVTSLQSYGHLVHEEAPDEVAQICRLALTRP